MAGTCDVTATGVEPIGLMPLYFGSILSIAVRVHLLWHTLSTHRRAIALSRADENA